MANKTVPANNANIVIKQEETAESQPKQFSIKVEHSKIPELFAKKGKGTITAMVVRDDCVQQLYQLAAMTSMRMGLFIHQYLPL
jgi:hypothetical protein